MRWDPRKHPRNPKNGRFWDTPRLVRFGEERRLYRTGQHDDQGRVHIQSVDPASQARDRSGMVHESWLNVLVPDEPPRPMAEQLREDVLEALDPVGTLRRKGKDLLVNGFGVGDREADESLDDHLTFARNGLSAPITDQDLDSLLESHISMLGPEAIDYLRTIERKRWQDRFPNTTATLRDIESDLSAHDEYYNGDEY